MCGEGQMCHGLGDRAWFTGPARYIPSLRSNHQVVLLGVVRHRPRCRVTCNKRNYMSREVDEECKRVMHA